MHTSFEHPVFIFLFVLTLAILLSSSFPPLTSVTLKRRVDHLCIIFFGAIRSIPSFLLCIVSLISPPYFPFILSSQFIFFSCLSVLSTHRGYTWAAVTAYTDIPKKGGKKLIVFMVSVLDPLCLSQWENVTRTKAAFDCFSAGISQLTKVCMGLWRYKSLCKCLVVIIIIMIIINFKMPEVGF